MWEKVKSWFKKFGGWVVTGIGSIFIIWRVYTNHRAQQRAVDRDYRERELETERLNQRIKRTTELESEFLESGREELEECSEHIRAAEDTTDRLEQSNYTAEQAIEELRRRFSKPEGEE